MNQRFTIFAIVLMLSFFISNHDARSEDAQKTFPEGLYLFGVDKQDDPNSNSIERISPDELSLQTEFRLDKGSVGKGRFSHKGSRLAFVKFNDDSSIQIVILDVDKKNPITFDLKAGATVTAWSPDDTQLAFHEYDEATDLFHSYVIDLNTGTRTQRALPPDYIAEDWHPTDELITAIYLNPRNRIYRTLKGDSYPTRQLDLVMSDGKTKPITKLPEFDNIWSRFSPGGDRIAYYSRYLVGEKPFETVVVCQRDGSDRKAVFEFSKYGESQGLYWFRPLGGSVWGPDGGSLATLVDVYKTTEDKANHDFKLELVIVSIKGEPVKRISLTDLGIQWVSGIEWR